MSHLLFDHEDTDSNRRYWEQLLQNLYHFFGYFSELKEEQIINSMIIIEYFRMFQIEIIPQSNKMIDKGIMQISEHKFFKKYPSLNFSACLSSHTGCLGLAVERKIWEKIEFENERE